MEVVPGGYEFSRGGQTYRLTEAGWQVWNVASEALMQPGVSDETDPAVLDYLEVNMPPGAVQELTPEDRAVLEENRFGFAI